YPESVVAFDCPTNGKQWVRQVFLELGHIDIRWAGAVSTGSADDSTTNYTAINKCVVLGSAFARVYVPKGEFYVSNTGLSIPDDTHIYGAGWRNAKLVFGVGPNVPIATDSAGAGAGDGGCNNFVMEDLYLDFSNATAGESIRLLICNYFRLERLYIYDFSDYGIVTMGATYGEIVNNIFEEGGTYNAILIGETNSEIRSHNVIISHNLINGGTTM
ncbi:unnamed protein product, partial [marine sediment metagenome]